MASFYCSSIPHIRSRNRDDLASNSLHGYGIQVFIMDYLFSNYIINYIPNIVKSNFGCLRCLKARQLI